MTIDKIEFLQKAQQVLDAECASKAAELILDADSRLIERAPSREEAKDLRATLKVRLWNTTHGLVPLIGKLEDLDPASKVLGYGFISPKLAGNVYVASDDQRFLGAAIVDRNSSPAEVGDLGES